MRRRAGRFGLDVIGVNVWEHRDARREAAHFCAVHGLHHPVLLDETGAYTRLLGVRGVPLNVLVDAAGVVHAVGATTPDELSAALPALFAANGG